jgi:hypothetical protein
MITPTMLQTATSGITNLVHQSPATTLALTTLWLDPIVFEEEYQPDVNYDAYENNSLLFAISIARTCFPSVYTQAITGLRNGTPREQIQSRITTGIEETSGIPISDCFMDDSLPAYIPLWSHAADYHEYWLKDQPVVAALLQYFGGVWEAYGGYHPVFYMEVPDDASEIARIFYWSLQSQKDKRYSKQLAHLLIWTFGISGNSLVDLDEETLWSINPLEWEPDQVQFASEMIAEANGIINNALLACVLLRYNLTANLALLANIERIRTTVREKGPFRDDIDDPDRLNRYYGLDWPPLDSSPV